MKEHTMESENHKAGSNFKRSFSPFSVTPKDVPTVFIFPDTAV